MLEIIVLLIFGLLVLAASLAAAMRLCSDGTCCSLYALSRSILEVVGLVIASAFLTAIVCCTSLSFIWLCVLIVFQVPMAVQTGADYKAHPVFDHPAFFPLTIFIPVLLTAMLGYG